MSKEIENAVSTLLAEAGVTFTAVYRGITKNAFGGTHEMDKWKCEFTNATRPNGPQSFDYFTGMGHRTPAPKPMDNGPAPRRNTLMWEKLEKQRKPVAPHAAGVLHSLILDSSAAEQSFNNWCSDFGYDNDSRKALKTYEACQENADKLRRVFYHTTVEKLSEALQDY